MYPLLNSKITAGKHMQAHSLYICITKKYFYCYFKLSSHFHTSTNIAFPVIQHKWISPSLFRKFLNVSGIRQNHAIRQTVPNLCGFIYYLVFLTDEKYKLNTLYGLLVISLYDCIMLSLNQAGIAS